MDFFVENYKLLLEIFGYIGTALVIISMTMTSVLKLRIINMCGGFISLIYAILCNTWPVVVLNGCLICINFVQTVRALRKKSCYGHAIAKESEATVRYFLSHYEKDIRKLHPNCSLPPKENSEVHIFFSSGEMIGVLIGERQGDTYRIDLGYVTPQQRNTGLGKFLFSVLKDQGIGTLSASDTREDHSKYLKKLGFVEDNGTLSFRL